MPEYFKGTWGNEDNAFAYKMKNLGYPMKIYPFEMVHLHHEHKTVRNEKIKEKIDDIKLWNRQKWLSEMKMIDDNWGV